MHKTIVLELKEATYLEGFLFIHSTLKEEKWQFHLMKWEGEGSFTL